MWIVFAGFLTATGAGHADVVVAARTLRAQSVITADDIALIAGDTSGALVTVDEAIGQETRVAIYAGRAIRVDDVGPPAIIERNQIVSLVYRRGTLSILAEGRALGRGGIGDSLRAINLASRVTVSGFVAADGTLTVFSNE
jgi:flagella basal body P-ring formation protein FlgA